jgi:hypothetical protein
MQAAVPPDRPTHRHDADPGSTWLDEPATEPAREHEGSRRRAVLPAILLVAAIVLIVALIVLL